MQERQSLSSAHPRQLERWRCIAASRAAGRRSGRPGAPRDRISLECLRPPAGADRGLQVSRGNVLKHLLLERQIGNKTFEPNVFPLQILHPSGLIELKTAVLLAPAIVA